MSLASQLKNIASNNAASVLDRKRRQKIHSASIIYDSKTAATQDYASILETSQEALESLIELNDKFAKFQHSLFSGTSVSVDRNVMGKEQLEDLNAAIETFLDLVAPYWNLKIGYNAVEWLVRRFQIQIHNAEHLLLSLLPYHSLPLFVKVVSIMPQLPPLFGWLANLKKLNKPATKEAIIRAGFNDSEFAQMYINYVMTLNTRKCLYHQQLVFFVSCSVASLAYNATNEPYLQTMTPQLLKVCLALATCDKKDPQVAGCSILVVLFQTVPFDHQFLAAAVSGILSNPLNTRVALEAINQLYKTVLGVPEPLLQIQLLKILSLVKSGEDVLFDSKFMTAVYRSALANGSLKDCKWKLSSFQFTEPQRRAIIEDCIKLCQNSKDQIEDLVPIVEFFVSHYNEDVLIVLKKCGFSQQQLELALMTSLPFETAITVENDKEQTDEVVTLQEREESVEWITELPKLVNQLSSFLAEGSLFEQVLPHYIIAAQQDKLDDFERIFGSELSFLLTFYLKVAVTPKCPLTVRARALLRSFPLVKQISTDTCMIPIFPIFLSLLQDTNSVLRKHSVEFIKILKANLSKISDNFFLNNKVYGESKELMMLNPKDFVKFLDILIENASAFVTDKNQLLRVFAASVFSGNGKKISDLILAYLTVHSMAIDAVVYVKLVLMKLVSLGTSNVKNSAASSYIYGDFLNEYLGCRDMWKVKCLGDKVDFNEWEHMVVDILNLTPSSIAINNHKKTAVVTSFTFLRNSLQSADEDLVKVACDKLVKQFSEMKTEYQSALTESIIENATSPATASEVQYDALALLQQLDIPGSVFAKLFGSFKLYNEKSGTALPELENVPKRRRRSSASTRSAMKKDEVAQLAETHLRNVILVLETFEKTGANVEVSAELLENLFTLMSDLETLGTDGKLPVVYAQELLADCLLVCIRNAVAQKTKLSSSSVRADVLVSIIRSATSPQLQNKLLLVIAELAILEPEFVLHSIMPIFTFMGAYTVKQDDEYSSYVIDQTISKVVPALQAGKESKSAEAEFLLQSFVSALSHIPRHRRVNLFHTLCSIMGPHDSLHVVMFLIAKQYSRAVIRHKTGEANSVVEFERALLASFSTKDQLQCVYDYLRLWDTLKLTEDEPVRSIFEDFQGLPEDEFQTVKQNLLTFIDASVFSSSGSSSVVRSVSHLKVQVSTVLLDDSVTAEETSSLYAVFNEIVAFLVDHLIKCAPEFQPLFSSLLGHLLSLLPIKFFAESVGKLIETISDTSVVSDVVYLTASQFEHELTEDDTVLQSAQQLAWKLVDLCDKSTDLDITQNCLYTLSALIEKFKSGIDSQLMIKLLGLVTKDKQYLYGSPEIAISSFNLLSNIVTAMGIKTIGFFPKIMDASFSNFARYEQAGKEAGEESDSESEDDTASLVQTSVVLLHSCLVKQMPQIMASHLKKVLLNVLCPNNVDKSINLSVLNIIFVNTESKALLRTLCQIWESPDFDRKQFASSGMLLNLLTNTVESLEKSDAITVMGQFIKFMLSSFNFICDNNQSENRNAITKMESLIINSELQFVMKLNDKTFRPLFAQCVEWAFENNELANDKDFNRVCIFLKFFNKFQDNLKSIITNYYAYFLENMYGMLEKFTEKSHGSEIYINLKRLVFLSLGSSFKYDQDEYWTLSGRFDKMSSLLCQQLKYTEAKLGKHLTRAITELAVKNSKIADHNRDLNKQLLSHLKYDCTQQEKFSTIKVFENIYTKVGTSWMSLLPQLVPVIAELLEDDDEKVESEVRSGLVKVIEDVLGEKLDKYLD